MTSPNERLDAAMDARRLDLGLTWQEVAQAASISPATLRAMRAGTNMPSALTRRRLEDALRWERGSIQAILDGGDPTPVDAPANPAPGADLDRRLAMARELLARAQELLDEAGDRRQERGGRAS